MVPHTKSNKYPIFADVLMYFWVEIKHNRQSCLLCKPKCAKTKRSPIKQISGFYNMCIFLHKWLGLGTHCLHFQALFNFFTHCLHFHVAYPTRYDVRIHAIRGEATHFAACPHDMLHAIQHREIYHHPVILPCQQ